LDIYVKIEFVKDLLKVTGYLKKRSYKLYGEDEYINKNGGD
jgi:hypothetical protein